MGLVGGCSPCAKLPTKQSLFANILGSAAIWVKSRDWLPDVTAGVDEVLWCTCDVLSFGYNIFGWVGILPKYIDSIASFGCCAWGTTSVFSRLFFLCFSRNAPNQINAESLCLGGLTIFSQYSVGKERSRRATLSCCLSGKKVTSSKHKDAGPKTDAGSVGWHLVTYLAYVTYLAMAYNKAP